MGESSTKGLDAFVSSERVIWLDCQPLLSAAAAERELAAAHTKVTTLIMHLKMMIFHHLMLQDKIAVSVSEDDMKS